LPLTNVSPSNKISFPFHLINCTSTISKL
jgi:hypothetical protein